MAIQSRTINNSLTEIYVVGENFITQAFPTNFHQFWTKKILTASEKISDFKEVTDSEKNTIANKDAQWEAPSEELIAQAEAARAVYNHSTGFFELNTLVDITEDEMRLIMTYGKFSIESGNAIRLPIRTNIRVYNSSAYIQMEARALFVDNERLETLSVNNCLENIKDAYLFFSNNPKLRKVIGNISFVSGARIPKSCFRGLAALVDIKIKTPSSLSIGDSPLLSLASIQYMIDNAYNTSPITITLHPDAYARLTDELIAQATEKQITFATPT